VNERTKVVHEGRGRVTDLTSRLRRGGPRGAREALLSAESLVGEAISEQIRRHHRRRLRRLDWTPPAGFTLWTGAGTYAPGTLAYQYAAASCTPFSQFSRCWGVNVISEYSCRERFGRRRAAERHSDRLAILSPNPS
jgi:hypothetical protein